MSRRTEGMGLESLPVYDQAQAGPSPESDRTGPMRHGRSDKLRRWGEGGIGSEGDAGGVCW